jgi:hypothetical protein
MPIDAPPCRRHIAGPRPVRGTSSNPTTSMPAKIYRDKDADLKVLAKKTCAVIGFGSQGHAHALNLKESGVNVVIGLYPKSKSIPVAKAKGFEVLTTAEAVRKADVIYMAVPDTASPAIYEKDVAPNLTPGKALMFSHGLAIHFGFIKPPADIDVLMVAPKGPGHIVRRQFLEGKGVPSLIAIHQDASGKAKKSPWPGPRASAAPVAGSSRQPSRKRPRPTCSASSACSAAAPPPWSRLVMRRWSKPATSPRWPISNACTS